MGWNGNERKEHESKVKMEDDENQMVEICDEECG